MGAAAESQGRLSAELGPRTARAYALRLLADLGLRARRPLALGDEHPALSWARSGLMALTGTREGEPQMCPAPLAACADGALAALAGLAPDPAFEGLRGSQLLAERAALTGHSRNGAISPGGTCRLLRAADGNLALNLAREDDWGLLPAWLEGEVARDWETLAQRVRERSARELVARGREIGLAVALNEALGPAPWFSLAVPWPGEAAARWPRKPRVVDLSSLWAGPLCGQLLQQLGAEVIKVESLKRPDGARSGPQAFFDLMNAGKACVALDFGTSEGRRQLRELVDDADIVIEASRPRALRQLGLDAEALVREHPGLTWLSITGHGRAAPAENWIAYGDDAAVAAGLSALMYEATGQDLVVGDALADPLTGLHAALAAWAGFLRGGALVSLSLCDVVRHCLEFDRPVDARQRTLDWTRQLKQAGAGPARPRMRTAPGLAKSLGADTGILRRPRPWAAPASGR